MKKYLPITIVTILILLTVCFIFSRSLLDISNSQEESERVVEIVEPILEPIFGEGNVTDHLVRKLAHFAEFGLLGIELAVFILLMRKLRAQSWISIQSFLNALFFALSIALCDETIQIFSERGSQVQDVWLDFFGAMCGMIVIIGTWSFWRNVRKKLNTANNK